VRKGDTLFSIARKYNLSVQQLADSNNLEGTTLLVGQKLILPQGYTVKKGDTLYSIARELEISIEELLVINPGVEASLIKAGQILNVPQIKELTPSDPPPVKTKLTLPYNGYLVESDSPRDGWLVSLSNGKTVHAASSGKIVWVGEYRGFEKVCIVEDSSGVILAYGGLDKIDKVVGAEVEGGDSLGILPRDRDTLYFFSFKDGKPINPGAIF